MVFLKLFLGCLLIRLSCRILGVFSLLKKGLFEEYLGWKNNLTTKNENEKELSPFFRVFNDRFAILRFLLIFSFDIRFRMSTYSNEGVEHA